MNRIHIPFLRCIGASAAVIACIGLSPLAAMAHSPGDGSPTGEAPVSTANAPAPGDEPGQPTPSTQSNDPAREEPRGQDAQTPDQGDTTKAGDTGAQTPAGPGTDAMDPAPAPSEQNGESEPPPAVTGKWVRHAAGWRYELSDGTWMKNGVFNVGGGRYAFTADGYVPVGWYESPERVWYVSTENGVRTGWYQEGASWYYLDSSGAMATGWLPSGAAWYYLSPTGAMVTGWYQEGGAWYHFEPSGAMAASKWVWSGAWYYLTGSGAMATGWFIADGTWYYAGPTGAMTTGWVNTDGSWYYLLPSGALASGWIQDGGGGWYYLDPDHGSAMVSGGWVMVGGKWNYFDRWKGFWVTDRADFEADWNYAKTLYSPTNYLVVVDTGAPHCMTFYWGDGSWQPLTDMPCSVGKPSTPTIKGTFTIKSRGPSFGHGYTAYWWTQFSGDYLFHSILYYQGTYTVMDGTLGGHVSHGCVRLRYEDAKWFHDTIPSGTYVTIY